MHRKYIDSVATPSRTIEIRVISPRLDKICTITCNFKLATSSAINRRRQSVTCFSLIRPCASHFLGPVRALPPSGFPAEIQSALCVQTCAQVRPYCVAAAKLHSTCLENVPASSIGALFPPHAHIVTIPIACQPAYPDLVSGVVSFVAD